METQNVQKVGLDLFIIDNFFPPKYQKLKKFNQNLLNRTEIDKNFLCALQRSAEMWLIIDKGSFTNYVDKILAFFDHLFPSVDICYGMNVHKNWTFWTTYLPRLVNVVCDRPLR